eukprot:10338788-Alexandrium_andersonii.AAC.1
MATDNFDAAFALAEDEFGVMCRLAREMRTARAAAGKSLWDAVLETVLPLLGNRWTRNDMARMWNFCTTTQPEKL